MKNKKPYKKDFSNSKAPFKGKFVPKSEQNQTKGTPKPIKCFECQGYGHTAAKCANRR